MNATQRLILAIIISLEIALTQSVTLNLFLLASALLILLLKRTSLKKIGFYFLIAIIPVFGTFWSFYLYGQGSPAANLHFGFVMGSRVLAFIFVGAWLTLGMTPYLLLTSLQQNLKLSATFAYGILGALNFMPRFKQAFGYIRAAGLMRDEALHFWQPTLYFKALVHALKWSESLAMAMTSHGFQEGAARSYYENHAWPGVGWLIMLAIIIVLQVVLWLSVY
ncbi:energy-coupling factor transporter transmembrane component T family protein [Eupransor demetentiae]|uniref:ECF-type transporter transmembrane protein EcfT (EcfT) n=1 Tax=Eupransor demetentiae TaxID=3109584 RepID=A0ABP0EU20_9LACO|nr:ECF-type transporter transmembrane protein EcfT (EcfT) [Lactobacillaceae bacterium LMG 33000]